MNLKYAGIAVTLLAALLTGCSSKPDDAPANSSSAPKTTTANPAPPPGAAVTIKGAGATFPKPIYEKWFAKYQATAAVDYAPIGSGKGVTQLKEKTVDFGASDAPLNAEQAKDIPGAVHIPTVGGAVAIGYNLPGFQGDLQFTPEILAGIYLGKITKWNDPALVAANPGKTLPDLKITSVHRSDSSGTTYIFTNYLATVSADWKTQRGAGNTIDWKGGIAGDKSDGVSTQVTRTPGAVGYFELTYALAKKLSYGAVKNKAGNFIKPDVESTQAAIADYADTLAKNITTLTVDAPGAKSYPISSLTYVILTKGGTGTANAAKFWDWAMQPEQQAEVKALNYAPLPDALVKVNLAALKELEK